MKLVLNVCFVTFIILFFAAIPNANANNFKLNKSRIVFEQDDRRAELKIYNESNRLQSYRILLTEMEMNQEGNLVPVEEYTYSAKEYLRVGPRIVRDIPPNSFARIKLIKKGVKERGEFRSHLLIEAIKTEVAKQVAGVFIQPNIKYVIPVFVRNYPDEEKASVVLEKHFVDKNTKALSLTFKREGLGSYSGNLVVKDMNGKELYRVNQVSIYPELQRRTFNTTISADESKQPLSVVFESLEQGNEIQFQSNI
ncbi:hypothetical protein [Pseudoalteromonas sp. MMG022]|uniref:hypothetical protein n=1 Tax=Pseudoalteromonas sp. MMG022 TaxID=2909978 RepID=UPI001F45B8E5|nr:hypothetical protein [Pseudoalteromonas sp. MMG022]MCF6435629.1 hypothetical protein [Pseudoalteromonas sp. MMG022]